MLGIEGDHHLAREHGRLGAQPGGQRTGEGKPEVEWHRRRSRHDANSARHDRRARCQAGCRHKADEAGSSKPYEHGAFSAA
jgi:hypothetical protein